MLRLPLPVRRISSSLGEIALIDRAPVDRDGAPEAPVRTVVLVHGLPTCKELWSEVIRALPRSWRVLAPDLPGFGASTRTAGPIDHAARARAVHEVVTQAGLDGPEAFDLVGHDLGASVVVQYLGDHGTGSVRRVGLLSAPVYPDFRKPRRVTLLRTRGLGEFLAPMAKPILLTRTVRQGMVHPEKYDGAFALAMQDTWEGKPGTKALLAALRWGEPVTSFAAYPTTLRFLDRPTLVIQGRRDPWIPADHAERLVSDVPDARLAWIEDGGHFLPVDVPDQIAALLDQFLCPDNL